MKLFGYDVTKASESREPLKDNRYLPYAIWRWLFNREHVKDSDTASLINAYRSWVYVAASRNAATFAATPLKLYAGKPSANTRINAPQKVVSIKEQDYLFKRFGDLPAVRKAVEVVEITEHPFVDLVTNVNPFMNKTDLLEISDLYQELTGDCYWYTVDGPLGIPQEIWPLPPDRTTIVPHPKLFISHYVYTLGAEKVKFNTKEIIHFKWPNPRSIYYGASPLMAIADTYNINQNMNNYENSLLSNNARPEGFFTTEKELDDITFKRLREELRETWTGVTNAGKTGLLDSGVTYNAVNMSPRELGFIQGRRWTKEEIFEAYDTPLGLFDARANRANAEAAQFTYAAYGISPRHRRFAEKINEQLMPCYDDKLFVAFENIIPEDKEFKLKEDKELFSIGARMINEIRQGRGSESIPEGDVPLVPNNLVPLAQAGQALPQHGGDASGQSDEELVEEMIESITSNILTQISGR